MWALNSKVHDWCSKVFIHELPTPPSPHFYQSLRWSAQLCLLKELDLIVQALLLLKLLWSTMGGCVCLTKQNKAGVQKIQTRKKASE